ncbi:MAG TPA: YigZ family protein [Chloroflexota bacterium]
MRDEPQPFRTVNGSGRAELEIKRSRFLALAAPSADEEAARALIAGERERHPEANHHTFAYRLGHTGDISRFSDDGEPGGTAGRPMMEVLLREALVDVVVVVTRYFGGTLLGAGGLTRAYGKAATEAIHAAGFRRMRPHTLMRAEVAYPLAGALEHALARAGLTVRDMRYTDTVSLSVPVPASEEAAFARLVADVTAGMGQVEAGERLYLPD